MSKPLPTETKKKNLADVFITRSQNKAEAAQTAAFFKDEIVGVEVTDAKKTKTIFKEDEYIRKGATVPSLSKLRPAFDKEVSKPPKKKFIKNSKK